MGFIEAVKSGYKNAFKFKGRASRAEFWLFALYQYILILPLAMIGGFFFLLSSLHDAPNSSYAIPLIGGVVVLVCAILIGFPSFALTIKRLHDCGFSGWWLLAFMFVNFITFLAMVVGVVLAAHGTHEQLDGSLSAVVIQLVGELLMYVAGVVWALIMARKSEPRDNKWGSPANQLNNIK
ncbi:DUF805 domain-containing protein [Swingsia samuiensis]|nr:DUF805 domain-containing protein [Swingsia samuiensis]